MQVDQTLSNAAVEVPAKKVRSKPVEVPGKTYPQFNEDGTKMLDSEGKEVWGPVKMTKPKKVKAPKVVEYQLDEAGNQILDEAGNPIPVKKVRAPRPPRLDADGNPIPRKSNVFLDTQVLRLTSKVPTYRAGTKRGDIFASIKDGMTVGQFYELNGGKKAAHTFLAWYVTEAEVVEVE